MMQMYSVFMKHICAHLEEAWLSYNQTWKIWNFRGISRKNVKSKCIIKIHMIYTVSWMTLFINHVFNCKLQTSFYMFLNIITKHYIHASDMHGRMFAANGMSLYAIWLCSLQILGVCTHHQFLLLYLLLDNKCSLIHLIKLPAYA